MSTLHEFNSTVIELADQLSIVCPGSLISNNIGNLKMIIRSHPTKVIELFIIYVLPDKDKIDEGNNDFFLNKSYEDVVEKTEIPVGNIFEFKNIWYKLKYENQELVKQYMQLLCYHAQEYFLEKY